MRAVGEILAGSTTLLAMIVNACESPPPGEACTTQFRVDARLKPHHGEIRGTDGTVLGAIFWDASYGGLIKIKSKQIEWRWQMAKYFVYKGEDWLGAVIASDDEEAKKRAGENPDYAGFTHVEKQEEIQHEPHGA